MGRGMGECDHRDLSWWLALGNLNSGALDPWLLSLWMLQLSRLNPGVLPRLLARAAAGPGPLQSAGCVAPVVHDTGTMRGHQHLRRCKERIDPLCFGRSPRAEFESALRLLTRAAAGRIQGSR